MLYAHYFDFNYLIFIHFTNQITLKQSLAQTLNIIFKVSLIKRQTNIPLWTHMGIKYEKQVKKGIIPFL